MLTELYKPLIFLCTHQADNFAEREQLSTQDQHDELLQEYKRMLTVLQQPYIIYDWESPRLGIFEILERHVTEMPSWLTISNNTPV